MILMVGYVWAEGAKCHAMLAVISGGGGGNGLRIQPIGLCRGRKKDLRGECG